MFSCRLADISLALVVELEKTKRVVCLVPSIVFLPSRRPWPFPCPRRPGRQFTCGEAGDRLAAGLRPIRCPPEEEGVKTRKDGEDGGLCPWSGLSESGRPIISSLGRSKCRAESVTCHSAVEPLSSARNRALFTSLGFLGEDTSEQNPATLKSSTLHTTSCKPRLLLRERGT